MLELPKLGLASAERQAKVDRWARFLRAKTDEELEELAREDEEGIMSTAKKTLEDLSKDPEARRIASERESAVLMHRHLINASREDRHADSQMEALNATTPTPSPHIRIGDKQVPRNTIPNTLR